MESTDAGLQLVYFSIYLNWCANLILLKGFAQPVRKTEGIAQGKPKHKWPNYRQKCGARALDQSSPLFTYTGISFAGTQSFHTDGNYLKRDIESICISINIFL